MSFLQPFILVSEFVQHVGLIALAGILVVDYSMYRDPSHAFARRNIRMLGAALLFFSVWIIGEYFIPARTFGYSIMVQIPLMAAVALYLVRVDCTSCTPNTAHTLKYLRIAALILFVSHALFGVARALASMPIVGVAEGFFVHALFKSAEVVLLYGFVIYYLRYTKDMRPSIAFEQQHASVSTKVHRASFTRAAVFTLVFLSGVMISERVDAITLSTRIGDQSTEVKAGDRVYFDVEIKWPENTKRQDLRVEYQILDEGKIIASEKVLRAVETQASFLDYIVVPTNTTAGMKELNVIIETYDESLKENLSATFFVLKTSNQLMLYFYILLAAIALVVILVISQIIIMSRTRQMLAHHSS